MNKDSDMEIESLNYAPSPAKSLPVCRICLSDQEDDQIKNPLVSPCHCKGTMNFVHVKCLKGWIDSKRETRTTDSTHSYQWTIIRCELCHVPYPRDLHTQNGRIFKLFEFEIPKRTADISFVIFETVYTQKEVKTIHVVTNEKETDATIGRAFDAGMRVPDISVSRYHANIVFQNDHFYIKDNDSKFGTLLLLNRPLVIDP